MHFNYIPTGRAKAHVQLGLTPNERIRALETLGKEIVRLHLQSKEELKSRYSTLKVDRFFSICPQYASVTKDLSSRHGEKFMVEAHYAAKKGVENAANFLEGCGCAGCTVALNPMVTSSRASSFQLIKTRFLATS